MRLHHLTVRVLICCAAFIWTAVAQAGAIEPGANAQPNVILCMADDMGWGDTGYNGHRVLTTPHLDAMADVSLRFDRFYSASAVCSPTRGSCLTGRHPQRYGVATANVGHLRAGEISLAKVLKEAGYRTGHFGKWHLGTLSPTYSGKGAGRKPEVNYMTPGMAGFDQWFSTEFAVSTWDPYDPANSHLGGGRFDVRALFWRNGENVTATLKGCTSRLTMDEALKFIRTSASEDKPFFAVIWFHAPHLPVVGGQAYREAYAHLDEDTQHYYAVMSALDEQVGRLRASLRELGVADNTMLWFASDNGPEGNPGPRGRSQGSAGPFRGRKRSLYEGGVRVPALLEWPARIRQGRATSIPCVTSDYFPTVLDALGQALDPSRPYDGVSLLPLIDDNMSSRPAPIAFDFHRVSSLSDNRYKLIHNSTGERLRSDNGNVEVSEYELYDLIEDPSETVDLAKQHPEIVERMKAELSAWRESCKRSAAGEDY